MVSYKDAGVDVAAGDAAVKSTAGLVRTTWAAGSGKVIESVGFLGNIIENPDGTVETMKTDSAGTKTIIASLMDMHSTIGIDAAAMVANDLAVGCMWPEYGINCILMGQQIPARTRSIVAGYVRGCIEAGCRVINGEMAELPGVFAHGHYEIIGAMKGKASSFGSLVTGEHITPGMGVFGLASSGVHSNGYSLVRRVFGLTEDLPAARRTLAVRYADLQQTLGETLLTPTRIYVDDIRATHGARAIAGFAHITGGGMHGKIPRVLPRDCSVRLRKWPLPPLFDLIRQQGGVAEDEMLRTFNCGYGLVAVTHSDLTELGYDYLGEVVPGAREVMFTS